MSDGTSVPSTTEAVAADAAGREENLAAAAPLAAPTAAGNLSGDDSGSLGGAEGRTYLLGEGVRRTPTVPYERQRDDPLYRPLRIYAVDPSVTRLEGAVATVNVAYEPLEPGPVGRMFEVDPVDGERGVMYRSADLEDRNVLMTDGYDPSPADPRFHQQMVYAVSSNVYSTFKAALGRNPVWGFGAPGQGARLLLRPHYKKEANAYYENLGDSGELRFGYVPADEQPALRTIPGGYVFTCLSHDIIVHEVSHALLDGLRARFLLPTNRDVLAFHEGFADLVAIFQHFSYPEVVHAALRKHRDFLRQRDLLTGELA